MDFMADSLYHGGRFRTMNVLDEDVREALDIVIDTSIPGGRVEWTLDRLVGWCGRSEAIRVDNGQEYLSQVFRGGCWDNGITLHYIQSGRPNQNAYIERFNRTCRHEVLDAYVFESLDQMCEITRQRIQQGTTTRQLGTNTACHFLTAGRKRRKLNFELSH